MKYENIAGWRAVMTAMMLGALSLCHAQTWRVYAAYTNHTAAEKYNGKIFVVSDGGLFSYDPEDTDVETYDKSTVLSESGISYIKATEKALILLYSNGNIDILEGDDVYNMTELRDKVLDDKTINELRVADDEALISTNSGLVIMDTKSKTFSEYYNLGTPVKSCILKSGIIYLQTAKGVYKGERKKNLLDAESWTLLSEAEAKAQVDFDAASKAEKKEMETLLTEVESIHPEGPLRNYCYRLRKKSDGGMLVAGGCFNYPAQDRTGTIMNYQNGKWTAFDETEPQSSNKQAWYYRNIVDIIQDPKNPDHTFAAAACSGLYEFQDGKLTGHYNNENSPLTSILPDNGNAGYYVRITALAYDDDDNLWMLNNECDTVIRILCSDGKWQKVFINDIKGYPTFDHIVFDNRGWAWINSRRTTSAGHKAGILVLDNGGTVSNTGNDTHIFQSKITNQDGKEYSPDVIRCIMEDRDGAIWIGTGLGPFMTDEPENIFNTGFTYTQPKVSRNDGTLLADYLLSGVSINCMAYDGGNRKWFGTASNGVYLTNADGTETILHFTAENSPLIHNTIYDILVDGETGEVFFATEDGLCSYMSDATDPVSKFDKESVKVYPNPVNPDYDGNICITGFMSESSVSIVNAAGKLVCKGTSTGGEFTWNGRMADGKKARSGIYFILATDENGDESVAGKFLIVRE